MIVAPFLGVLIYLIVESKDMAERNMQTQREYRQMADEHIRSVAGGSDPTEQIAKGKQLLDSGAITAEEFESLKRKALAT